MNNDRPIIFGEVLFDQFPDQARLGGAPFNVAWHLQGFGLEPFFISRVGDDLEGKVVLDKMSAWGMDTSGVQMDPEHPTGQVLIEMQGEHHTFEIKDKQAYDYIDHEIAIQTIPKETSLLYHGSLALRNEISRRTLAKLKVDLSAPCFVDINMRQPWWGENIADLALHGNTWVKLSQEELDQLQPGDESVSDRANLLRQRLNYQTLFVTQGKQGATLITVDDVLKRKPTAQISVVDTVGAGDTFAAVAILGITKSWDNETTLLRAMSFAEAVCGINGALFENKTTYNEFLDQWT